MLQTKLEKFHQPIIREAVKDAYRHGHKLGKQTREILQAAHDSGYDGYAEFKTDLLDPEGPKQVQPTSIGERDSFWELVEKFRSHPHYDVAYAIAQISDGLYFCNFVKYHDEAINTAFFLAF